MKNLKLLTGKFTLLTLAIIAVGCTTDLPTSLPQPAATIDATFIAQYKQTRTPEPTPSQEWLNWSRRWLEHTPCKAPCWENITPNLTTVGEALIILRDSPIIDTDSVHIERTLCGYSDAPELAYSRQIVWKWTYAEGGEGGVIDYVQIPPDNAISQCKWDVSTIEIITPDASTLNSQIIKIKTEFLGPNTHAYNIAFRPTLSDLIKSYGEPSHVVVVSRPEYSWYYVNLIYKAQGIVLKKVSRSLITLDGNMDFGEVVFSDDPLQEGIEVFNKDTLQAWKGIQDYFFYCRYEDGSPCK